MRERIIGDYIIYQSDYRTSIALLAHPTFVIGIFSRIGAWVTDVNGETHSYEPKSSELSRSEDKMWEAFKRGMKAYWRVDMPDDLRVKFYEPA
jgi:hypothetical protein